MLDKVQYRVPKLQQSQVTKFIIPNSQQNSQWELSAEVTMFPLQRSQVTKFTVYKIHSLQNSHLKNSQLQNSQVRNSLLVFKRLPIVIFLCNSISLLAKLQIDSMLWIKWYKPDLPTLTWSSPTLPNPLTKQSGQVFRNAVFRIRIAFELGPGSRSRIQRLYKL
jgi:hypothetical protein